MTLLQWQLPLAKHATLKLHSWCPRELLQGQKTTKHTLEVSVQHGDKTFQDLGRAWKLWWIWRASCSVKEGVLNPQVSSSWLWDVHQHGHCVAGEMTAFVFLSWTAWHHSQAWRTGAHVWLVILIKTLTLLFPLASNLVSARSARTANEWWLLEDVTVCVSNCAPNVTNWTGLKSGVSWAPDGVSLIHLIHQEQSKLHFCCVVFCWRWCFVFQSNNDEANDCLKLNEIWQKNVLLHLLFQTTLLWTMRKCCWKKVLEVQLAQLVFHKEQVCTCG